MVEQIEQPMLVTLKTRESLWNKKCESYKNRNTKKNHYVEIVIILKEDCEDIGLGSCEKLNFCLCSQSCARLNFFSFLSLSWSESFLTPMD